MTFVKWDKELPVCWAAGRAVGGGVGGGESQW